MDFIKENKKILGIGLIFISIFFCLGYFFGQRSLSQTLRASNVYNKDIGSSDLIDFEPFWKTWNLINEKYMPTGIATSTKVDDQKKVYGAIAGLVSSLGDPYTVFFPPTESKQFKDEISGSFEGVGMEVDIKAGKLTVIAPLKDTPAYKAGIKSGDQIVFIDGKPTENLKTEEAISMIKGKKGTEVVFTIKRDGVKDDLKISVIRDVISIPVIDTEMKSGVFIIRLYSFSATSPDLFREALRKFMESGSSKLILDLRGNPGGYLEAAVDMASWFLPVGKVVVKEESKDLALNEEFRSRGYDIFNSNLKMAILVDSGSASASEILAGALREHNKAKLVGVKTYGKGSVQELLKVTDDTSVKITVAKWLTPNGHSLSEGGLVPDVEVKFDLEKFKKDKYDNQLQEAINLLNK